MNPPAIGDKTRVLRAPKSKEFLANHFPGRGDALANSRAAARWLKRAISARRIYWRPQILTVVSIPFFR